RAARLEAAEALHVGLAQRGDDAGAHGRSPRVVGERRGRRPGRGRRRRPAAALGGGDGAGGAGERDGEESKGSHGGPDGGRGRPRRLYDTWRVAFPRTKWRTPGFGPGVAG